MSFLTPLYLFRALLVGLPILFHMIRRTPRGRREFSSVMFLEPSPPKVTRRSRIEHWLLLLLRALAVILLAAAFARPFWRVTEEKTFVEGETRDFVLLLDTSASMRRENLWIEAVRRIEELLDDVEPLDRVSLIAFDSQPRVLTDFQQWTALDPAQRVSVAKTALRGISPTWAATNLGRALIDAVERLDAESTRDDVSRSQFIVVVSDLQAGSRLGDLQAYHWPPHVAVRLETIGDSTSPNNAAVQPFVHSRSDEAADGRVRVRVENAANSRREQFTLRWRDQFAEGNIPDDVSPSPQPAGEDATAVTVIVAPGQSRTVSAPPQPSGPGLSELVLVGDDHDFDNRCFVPPSTARTVTVTMFSDVGKDDPQGLWYYVERALESTPGREVVISAIDSSFLADQTASAAPDLIVVAGSPPIEFTENLRAYLKTGGTILFVLLDAADVPVLNELVGAAPVEAVDSATEDYSMLTDIEFSHPLFAALDHPRYSDFTKIRFWRHRTVDPGSLPDVQVLARFDDGDLAIGEIKHGDGRILLFTSGWHPDDSQLALSTKFVPMLNGLLDSAAGIVLKRDQYVVGDAVDLTLFPRDGGRVTAVTSPAGEEMAIESGTTSFSRTDQPGRYRVQLEGEAGQDSASFVINLDPAESRTEPLPPQSLTANKVNFAEADFGSSTLAERERQLRSQELENRQKLWRWLVLAAILLLLGETWLASRTARMAATGA